MPILATSGNDVLTGGAGVDTINGGAGSDIINSGAGDDIIDGGSGSDRLNAGSGNDTLIYRLSENVNSTDSYMGGSGIDTLKIEFTSAEWANATVRQEILEYLQHLAIVKTNTNTGEVSNGTASDFTFDFGGGAKLTVSMMEKLVIVVNGETINPSAPYITSNGAGSSAAVTIAENTTAVTTVAAFDIDSTTLTYSIVGGADVGKFTINPTTGVLSFVNAPNFEMPTDVGGNNVYDVQVRVSDGVNFDTQSIAVTVTNVNEAPVTTPVTLTAIAEDSDVRVITQAQLLGNASDVDSSVLTATGLSIATGTGTLVDNGNGTWNYTPALNDNTGVSFSYTVTDGSLTAVGSASLDITAVNDAPTGAATAVLGAGTEDTAYTVSAADLLAGFSDVDSATNGQVLGVSSLNASNGSAVQNGDGSWTITPTANFNGAVTLTYNVTDSNGGNIGGTQSYSLAAVNDAPVINNDVWVLSDNTSIATGIISASWFTNNDTDQEGNPIFVTAVTGLSGTGLRANYDGSGHLISITGATNSGTSSFNLGYTLSDGTASTTTVNNVTVSVIDTTSGVNTFTLNGNDFSYIDGIGGNDTLTGDAVLTGNAGIDYFIGSGGNDTLSGGDANDRLYGVGNDDVLNGEAGNDLLDGGNNTDILNGGVGNDTLTGGAGNDTFVFNTALNAATNVDTITDFEANGNDKIHLDDDIFTAFAVLANTTLTAANFASNAGGNATDANDYVLYDSSTGNLYYDADGNGAGARVLIAKLTVTAGTVDAADFIITT